MKEAKWWEQMAGNNFRSWAKTTGWKGRPRNLNLSFIQQHLVKDTNSWTSNQEKTPFPQRNRSMQPEQSVAKRRLTSQICFIKLTDQRLMRKIKALGINRTIFIWIKECVSKRKQRVRVKISNCVKWSTTRYSDCPSAMLYINDLFCCMHSKL